MPRIAVIIVNYNAGARLQRCLERLAAQTFRDFETIVIDNASSDTSLDAARKASPAPRVIEAGANLGFAAANNRAAQATDAEWLAFLNPDAYAEPDWLEELLAGAARHPQADAFGSAQFDDADPDTLDGAGDAYHVFGVPWRGAHGWPASALPSEGACFAPCAAAALWRRARFLELGGFDESFFCYGEDVDLGFRLRLAGGSAIQLPAARVRHEGSGISGRASDFTIYHGHRNRLWTHFKNMPGAFLWPLLPFHLLVNLYLLARFSFLGLARPYLRGLNDAWRGRDAIFAARRRVQTARRATLPEIARALAWSPLKPARRAPVVWRPR